VPQNLFNRRNVVNDSWDRRNNEPRFGEPQSLFPLVGLEWRM
jgi:hypothetical protein